jgi:hypothetical protein
VAFDLLQFKAKAHIPGKDRFMKSRLFYFLAIFMSLNSLVTLASVWAEEVSSEKIYTVSPLVDMKTPVYTEEKVYTVSPVVNAQIPVYQEKQEVEYQAVVVVNANFQVRQEPTQYYNASQVIYYVPVFTTEPGTDTVEDAPADTEESGAAAPEGNHGHGNGRGHDRRDHR